MKKFFFTLQQILILLFLLLMYYLIYHFSSSCPVKQKEVVMKYENEIPLTEDLMREHGLLDRILLIYEAIIQRIDTDKNFPVKTLTQTLDITQSFIENYHEKLEEDYVFPIFRKHNKEVELVDTLQKQHNEGRKITAELKNLTHQLSWSIQDLDIIKGLLHEFISMYRPHEAREDTQLFPLVRSLLSEEEFNNLSNTFEDIEHKLFGKNGFQSMVKKIAEIEKQLGIYKLEQFTPKE